MLIFPGYDFDILQLIRVLRWLKKWSKFLAGNDVFRLQVRRCHWT